VGGSLKGAELLKLLRSRGSSGSIGSGTGVGSSSGGRWTDMEGRAKGAELLTLLRSHGSCSSGSSAALHTALSTGLLSD
jgi:hypothetical protein